MYGTITMFNARRGYGFITTVSGDQYFFHVTNFLQGDDRDVPVLEGRVRFDVGPPISVGKKEQALRIQYCHKKTAATATVEKGGKDGGR
jgi:cold shock CspA family protein